MGAIIDSHLRCRPRQRFAAVLYRMHHGGFIAPFRERAVS